MVKYWSDRIKSWIYTDFRAFRTWHQLLSLPGVYRSNRGMRVWVKTEDVLALVPVLIFLLNFETVLTAGKMNNIIILQHQKPCAFLKSKSSNWPPLFVINLKNWYLSKMISFLKYPFVPTFLLIIARRCDQKNGNIFSQGPIRLGVFCPHFKSDICKHNRRSDVKLHNILFILFFIKKEKMKWNEMRTKPCVE